MLSRMDFSIQSSTVKTEMMQNIPIVIPKSERKVRNLFTVTDLMADKKLSLKSLNRVLNYLSCYGSPKVINSFGFYGIPFTIRRFIIILYAV